MSLLGTLIGKVFPPAPGRQGTGNTARYWAMSALREYVSLLTFYRPGTVEGSVIPFRIDRESFLIEQPDHEQDLVFPVLAVVSGEADADPIGLVPHLMDDTRDVFGLGSILQRHHEHTEVFQIDAWGTKRPERRAVLAGLEVAFDPTEERSGILFQLPNYYNQTARFTLLRTALVDGPDTIKDRRQAIATLSLEVNVVRLVDARTLRPYVAMEVT